MDRFTNEQVRRKGGIVGQLVSRMDPRVLKMVWTHDENGRVQCRIYYTTLLMIEHLGPTLVEQPNRDYG